MVLIDTSVWIEFFRGNNKYFSHISELLEAGNVHSVEPVFAELLQGARNKREVDIIQSYWNNINNLNERGLWLDAGILSQSHKLAAKDIGIIDAMIISYSNRYQVKLWSLDKKLLSVANKSLIYSPRP